MIARARTLSLFASEEEGRTEYSQRTVSEPAVPGDGLLRLLMAGAFRMGGEWPACVETGRRRKRRFGVQ